MESKPVDYDMFKELLAVSNILNSLIQVHQPNVSESFTDTNIKVKLIELTNSIVDLTEKIGFKLSPHE